MSVTVLGRPENQLINVDINNGSSATYAGAAVFPGYVMDVWNGLDGGNGFTDKPLLDSTGTTTPVTVSLIKNGGAAFWTEGDPNALLADCSYAPSQTVTLSKLRPNALFKLVAYTGGKRANEGGAFSGAINGIASGYSSAGATVSSFEEGTNYLFAPFALSDAQGTLSFTVTPNSPEINENGILCGFQVMSLPPGHYSPIITGQPFAPERSYEGKRLALSVAAAGSSPLSYRWMKIEGTGGSNIADQGRISGATSGTLVFEPLSTADSGEYRVEITNASGFATSRTVKVNCVDTDHVKNALIRRYSFNKGRAQDTIGNVHGTLKGAATATNGKLALTGAPGSYLQLPSWQANSTGLFPKDARALTLEVWFTTQVGGWNRVFDFGSFANGDGHSYVCLATQGSLIMVKDRDAGGQEKIIHLPPIANGRLHQVVTVLEQVGGDLKMTGYLDGVTQGSVTLEKASLDAILNDIHSESVQQNALGKSQFKLDPFFVGSIDDFKVYNVALSAEEVARTYLGPLQALHLQLNTQTLAVGAVERVSVLADYQRRTGEPATEGITYTSSDTNILAITSSGEIKAVAPGTAMITSSLGHISDNKSVKVSQLGIRKKVGLIHQYSFESSGVRDRLGNAHGVAYGGCVAQNGQLALAGAQRGYLLLPSWQANGVGIIPKDATEITLEMWFSTTVSGWHRVFDIGSRTQGNIGHNCIFLSSSGVLGMHFNGPTSTEDAEKLIQIQRPIADGKRHDVVVVIQQKGSALVVTAYLDGEAQGSMTQENASLQWIANDTKNGVIQENALGKSKFPDPFFDGSINEFRIYSKALEAAEVTQDFAEGPHVNEGTAN